MKSWVPLINRAIGSTLLFTLTLYACGRKESPQMAEENKSLSSLQTSKEAPKESVASDHQQRPPQLAELERLQGQPAPKRLYNARSEASRLEQQRLDEARAASANAQASNAFTVIEDAVKDMEKANIAFNTPQTMNRNDTVMIHLLLSFKDAADELKEKIREQGEKESAIIRVAPIMEARLTGPNFQITAVTPEEQGVSGQDNTEWKWEVKPQASGEQNLHLTLNAIFMVSGSQRKWSVRSFDKTITVQVTTGQQLAGFVGANWQWLWTVLAAPLIVALWNQQNAKMAQKTQKGHAT